MEQSRIYSFKANLSNISMEKCFFFGLTPLYAPETRVGNTFFFDLTTGKMGVIISLCEVSE